MLLLLLFQGEKPAIKKFAKYVKLKTENVKILNYICNLLLGYYNDAVRDAKCTKCPRGYSTTGPGATSSENCTGWIYQNILLDTDKKIQNSKFLAISVWIRNIKLNWKWTRIQVYLYQQEELVSFGQQLLGKRFLKWALFHAPLHNLDFVHF